MDPLATPRLLILEKPDWEEIPSLSISYLRDRNPDLLGEIALKGRVSLRINWPAKQTSKYDEKPPESIDVMLESDTVAQRGWAGLFIVCPLTGQRVQAIYSFDGLALSRAAYRLASCREMLYRRALRRQLLALLEKDYLYPDLALSLMRAELRRITKEDDVWAQAALEAAEPNSQRRAARRASHQGRDERRAQRQAHRKRVEASRRAHLKADELGAWAALRRAEGKGRAEALRRTAGLSVEPSSHALPLDLTTFDILSAPLEPLAEHLHVDVRLLRQEKRYWRLGELTTFPLTEGVLVGVDLRASVAPQVRFSFVYDGTVYLQSVPLVVQLIGNRQRPMFQCPSGDLVEVLAFRGGRFACVKAQRLLRPSEVARRTGARRGRIAAQN